eukprot:6375342-Karenia_brevis.AAC.1
MNDCREGDGLLCDDCGGSDDCESGAVGEGSVGVGVGVCSIDCEAGGCVIPVVAVVVAVVPVTVSVVLVQTCLIL